MTIIDQITTLGSDCAREAAAAGCEIEPHTPGDFIMQGDQDAIEALLGRRPTQEEARAFWVGFDHVATQYKEKTGCFAE
jgi:hypothetical protein